MNTQQRVTLAQLDTQAFALMGRLHVTLRRETGRVIDIEYMRHDPAYCSHVLDLAEHLEHDVVREICLRLREIFFGAGGLFTARQSHPLLAPGAVPLAAAQASPTSGRPDAPASTTAAEPPIEEQAYVGRLR